MYEKGAERRNEDENWMKIYMWIKYFFIYSHVDSSQNGFYIQKKGISVDMFWGCFLWKNRGQ
ncbi:hypothetical protein KHA80_10570 [Anaerobacillus sp. HL2]|nr:hypothetical protein KHA80_10570 [Anaerobacillus sp. HL2]